MGAGIMGCCLALELAKRDIQVDLIDMAPSPMTGASLHNEGKLHLGFVYANDPEKETHSIMLRGSLSFGKILSRLTECSTDYLMSSHPFHYFVPIDTQLTLDVIEEHFTRVNEEASTLAKISGLHYSGKKIDRYFQRNSTAEHRRLFSKDTTQGSFQTEERSVSTRTVAKILCEAVKKQPLINFIGSTKVYSVTRRINGEIVVESGQNGKTYNHKYACAANCLWDDKLRVDSTAGIIDDGPWLLRYKATVNLTIPNLNKNNIPSATGILGAYGDVVNHGNGSFYLSWYPLCKRAQISNSDGRKLHEMVHKSSLSNFVSLVKGAFPNFSKTLSGYTHRNFVKNNILEMMNYIPAMEILLREKKHFQLGGGVIVARGTTDINDPMSYLHQRSAIGPVAYGSYISVDTGKYCTAPMFALETADIVMDIIG